MERDISSIFNELSIIKTKELEECNRELNKHQQGIVRKALLTYKHELLESLEMYDHYLDTSKSPQVGSPILI